MLSLRRPLPWHVLVAALLGIAAPRRAEADDAVALAARAFHESLGEGWEVAPAVEARDEAAARVANDEDARREAALEGVASAHLVSATGPDRRTARLLLVTCRSPLSSRRYADACRRSAAADAKGAGEVLDGAGAGGAREGFRRVRGRQGTSPPPGPVRSHASFSRAFRHVVVVEVAREASDEGLEALGTAALEAALTALGAAPPPAPEAPTPWRDAALLERRLAETLPLVEEVCGTKFVKPPTVRVSRAAEVEEILRREVRPQLAATGQLEQLDEFARAASRMLLAKFEPETRVIHVIPATAQTIAAALSLPALQGEDVLRVILAHEATHALDFERFPLVEATHAQASSEALQALNAVIEGHAQFAARRVAQRLGIAAAFDDYTRAILALPPGLDAATRLFLEAQNAVVGFAYLQGHRFVEAVHAARGDEGVREAFRRPPTRLREVERPAEWLDPGARRKGPDLTLGLEPFRGLVPEARGWTWQAVAVTEAMLATQLALLPEAERAGVLEGLEEVTGGGAGGGGAQIIAAVLAFRTGEQAARFLAAERALTRAKDESMKTGTVAIVEARYEEGVGAEGKGAGFRAFKRVRVGTATQTVRSVVGHRGRHVFDLTLADVPEVSDEAIAKASDAALAALGE
jgi:hypothetical protein